MRQYTLHWEFDTKDSYGKAENRLYESYGKAIERCLIVMHDNYPRYTLWRIGDITGGKTLSRSLLIIFDFREKQSRPSKAHFP